MKLLICPPPFHDECLSSYLTRLSALNYCNPHDLWREAMLENTHYPQSSFSRLIDVCPQSIFNKERLCELTNVSLNEMESMSFSTALKKFSIPSSKWNRTRVLSKHISTHRKFCPSCLSETNYYKLIWQVSELKTCIHHNTDLIERCPSCNREIPILSTNSVLDFCPFCNLRLSSINPLFSECDFEEQRKWEDWRFLLNPNALSSNPLHNLSPNQSIALRLLYVITNSPLPPIKSEKSLLPTLLQGVRNSKSTETEIHLNTILSIIRNREIPLEKFLVMSVQKDFAQMIFAKSEKLLNQLCCQVSWCPQSKTPGQLIRTNTTIKTHKDGASLKYYMYCPHCSTEYALNKANNLITIREPLISLANQIIQSSPHSPSTLSILATEHHASIDAMRRSLIFLISNKLISETLVQLNLPTHLQPHIKNAILDDVIAGIPMKQIQKKFNLRYNEFLFYWLNIEIRLATHNHHISRPDKLSSPEEHFYLIDDAIQFLTMSKRAITIKSICEHLNVCPETLRNWGGLEYIKASKSLQSQQLNDEFRQNTREKVDIYFNHANQESCSVTSQDIYTYLGINRTVLVRKSPDLTNYIHLQLMYNKSLYFSKEIC